jgi:hypothetical protein
MRRLFCIPAARDASCSCAWKCLEHRMPSFHSTTCYLPVNLLGFLAISNGIHSFRLEDRSFLGSPPCVSVSPRPLASIHWGALAVLPEDGNTWGASSCALAIPRDNLLRLRVFVYMGWEGIDVWMCGCVDVWMCGFDATQRQVIGSSIFNSGP